LKHHSGLFRVGIVGIPGDGFGPGLITVAAVVSVSDHSHVGTVENTQGEIKRIDAPGNGSSGAYP